MPSMYAFSPGPAAFGLRPNRVALDAGEADRGESLVRGVELPPDQLRYAEWCSSMREVYSGSPAYDLAIWCRVGQDSVYTLSGPYDSTSASVNRDMATHLVVWIQHREGL